MRDQIIAILPRLRRFCMTLAGSPEDGDDLVQSTVERALSRVDQWQPGTRLDSWMFKIAQNLWIDTVRSRKRKGVHDGMDVLVDMPGSDGRTVMETRSELARTRKAIAGLPDEQRLVVALVLIDGHSYQAAAEVAGIPVGTVMSRLARARKTIEQVVFGSPETRKAWS